LAGGHNRQNAAMAAWTAWALFQPSHQALSDALCRFAGVEHRLERLVVPQADMVVFNDSKSTTPGATMTALKALQEDASLGQRPLHLLMGGRDKNTPLDELALLLQQAACHWRLTIWLYGEAAQRFADALHPLAGEHLRVNCRQGFQVAVSDAFAMALSALPEKPVIVLSPACASFDEFSDYEARGRAFKRLVSEKLTA
ncbi:MAG: cyanophycin synthetase, partial [Vampirovibrionales bacterium]|nr:cyanophycin synthetase [Vampirovibrionales bacterium]